MSSRRAVVAMAVAVTVVLGSSPGHAQVIAHPNQIRGTYRLVNENPEIVSLLQAEGRMGDMPVSAQSQPPAPQLRAASKGTGVGPQEAVYEITVESGEPGIIYEVTVNPRVTGTSCPRQKALSAPVEPEPAPDVLLDFEDCVGVVHVTLVDRDGDPVIPEEAYVSGGGSTRFERGTNEAWHITCERDLDLYLVLYYRTGTDPLHDTLRYRYTIHLGSVHVACDQLVEFPVVVCFGDGDPDDLGRIIGDVDVLGVDEIPTPDGTWYRAAKTAIQSRGPFGNERWDVLQRDPSSGAYELENLVPSYASDPPVPWSVESDVQFDVNGFTETLHMPPASTLVRAGETVDLGDLMVVDPTIVFGDVSVVGPPPSARRWGPMLSDRHGVGASGYGCPQVAPGARLSANLVRAYVRGPATYDDTSSTLMGSYELLTGGPYAEPSYHDVPRLHLSFSQFDDPMDPARWYSGALSITSPSDGRRLAVPGERIERNLRCCVSQVLLRYHSTGAPFYDPWVSASGRLLGADFEGVPRDEYYSIGAEGVPGSVSDAAVDGGVAFLAAEGHYTIDPQAHFVNPGGGTSRTDLRQLELYVGCRQILEMQPEIAVEVHESPDCVGTTPVRILGHVDAQDEVAAITWSVNGSPPADACRPCGAKPDFSIEIPPPGGPVEILIAATDTAGREASVLVVAGEAQEPSAMDLLRGDDPFAVRRTGPAEYELHWSPAAGRTYSLYRGTLDSLSRRQRYDHGAFGACGLGQARWSGSLSPGSQYFLVTSTCDFGEASLGRDSSGLERPGATPRCN